MEWTQEVFNTISYVEAAALGAEDLFGALPYADAFLKVKTTPDYSKMRNTTERLYRSADDAKWMIVRKVKLLQSIMELDEDGKGPYTRCARCRFRNYKERIFTKKSEGFQTSMMVKSFYTRQCAKHADLEANGTPWESLRFCSETCPFFTEDKRILKAEAAAAAAQQKQ